MKARLQFLGYKALTVILKPITAPIYYLVGDSWRFLIPGSDKPFVNAITAEADEKNQGIAVRSFGVFAGNIGVFIPKTAKQLKYVMDYFDDKPEGRLGYEIFNFVSGGKFFIGDTSPEAILHRKEFMVYVRNPKEYVPLVVTQIQETLEGKVEFDCDNMVADVVRTTLARKIFGANKLSPNLHRLFQSISSNIFSNPLVLFPKLYKLNPTFKEFAANYKKTVNEFFEDQLDSIAHALRNYNPNNPGEMNIIVRMLIDVIQKKNPKIKDDKFLDLLHDLNRNQIREYLQDPDILGMPMVFVADFVSQSISYVLKHLARQSKEIDILRQEIADQKLLDREGEIDVNLLRGLPILDSFYQESLRVLPFQKELLIMRYTSKEIKEKDLQIPANTSILVNLGWLSMDEKRWTDSNDFEPARFIFPDETKELKSAPFSGGKRVCAGKYISEYLFKAFVAFMVVNYDFRLNDKQQFVLTRHQPQQQGLLTPDRKK